mgnify:FL=1
MSKFKAYYLCYTNMYNTDFRCTYHHEEDDEVANDLYRSQFLQAFGLDKWEDISVSGALDNIMSFPDRGPVLEARAKRLEITNPMFALLRSEDKDGILFALLFQFDLFWATHAYLCNPCPETLSVLDNQVDAKVSICM